MNRFLRIPLTVLALLLVASLGALAQDEAAAPAAKRSAAYNDDFVAVALDRYYRVFGELPDSWAQIASSGVYDASMTGFNGEAVDPDDGSLDFPGDCRLQHSGSFYSMFTMTANRVEERRLLRVQDTYALQMDRLCIARKLVPEHDARLKSYKNNQAKLLQFAHIGQINKAIELYFGEFGMYPDTMDELFAAGFAPIRPETVNPVTGLPYRFDGSPGDLRLNSTEQFSAVIHVDEDGLISSAIEY